jgi:hypothetical protein
MDLVEHSIELLKSVFAATVVFEKFTLLHLLLECLKFLIESINFVLVSS